MPHLSNLSISKPQDSLSSSMDSTAKFTAPKLENPTDFGWFYNAAVEDPFHRVSDMLPTFDSLLEFDSTTSLMTFRDKNLDFKELGDVNKTIDELKGLEDFNSENFLLDYGFPSPSEDHIVDVKPVLNSFVQRETNVGTEVGTEVSVVGGRDSAISYVKEGGRRVSTGRKKAAPIELEEIQKYFDLPITKAAKEMNVGLTVLKKRCRELKITRWPHRKIKSLKQLINNVKELGVSTDQIMMLEEHTRRLKKQPDMELTEKTKKLRQACFKANYKKRRFLAPLPY